MFLSCAGIGTGQRSAKQGFRERAFCFRSASVLPFCLSVLLHFRSAVLPFRSAPRFRSAPPFWWSCRSASAVLGGPPFCPGRFAVLPFCHAVFSVLPLLPFWSAVLVFRSAPSVLPSVLPFCRSGGVRSAVLVLPFCRSARPAPERAFSETLDQVVEGGRLRTTTYYFRRPLAAGR